MISRLLLLPILLLTSTSYAVEVISVGKEGNVDRVFLTEAAQDGKLTLLPHHSFFSGANGARLEGEQTASDELNSDKTWKSIGGLNSAEQRIVFPLRLTAGGEVKGDIQGDGSFEITLGEQKASGSSFTFKNVPPGLADLVLAPKGKASIESVNLSGSAMTGAQLLRARWRPAAIHSGFTSSELGNAKSELWVMEVRPIYGEKGFYAPITTPFGYFGSTFFADRTSGGINFSMWSFQIGQPEPPLQQLSHLLAVGHPQATFAHFDHEGTGVKLKDWNPYEGQQITTTVLALKVQPGTPYDTYTGWFLDTATSQWRLYASGRKWSGERGVRSLLPGCFVEVPGPPATQRSGHIPRAADFRGWCRDEKGKWHPLDIMNGDKRDANREQTNCLWTQSSDGWFRMAMGGMMHFRYPQGVDVLTKPGKQLPKYLSPDAIKAFDTMPTAITIKRIARQGTTVHVEVELQTQARGKTEAQVFFGEKDALTFDHRWEKSKDLGPLKPGVQRIAFENAPASGFFRLLVKNETGSYFSAESGTWK